METLLQKNSLKNTLGRAEILRCLTTAKKPISAETIYRQLNQRFNLVTIYRNLNTFERKGIVFKEVINKTDFFYVDKKQHHHIVCRQCETVECVPCDHHIAKIKNFTNITHQLLLTGLCRRCGTA